MKKCLLFLLLSSFGLMQTRDPINQTDQNNIEESMLHEARRRNEEAIRRRALFQDQDRETARLENTYQAKRTEAAAEYATSLERINVAHRNEAKARTLQALGPNAPRKELQKLFNIILKNLEKIYKPKIDSENRRYEELKNLMGQEFQRSLEEFVIVHQARRTEELSRLDEIGRTIFLQEEAQRLDARRRQVEQAGMQVLVVNM